MIANAENSAAGFGITKDIGDTLLEWGVDVMTSGNHIWDKKEAIDYIAGEPRLLRPANYPAGVPGRGSYVAQTRRRARRRRHQRHGPRVHAQHRRPVRRWSSARSRRSGAATRVIIVDFHAEATSEKMAMGWHLDGKVTAVVGTHTHVQTADERILPNGTAYLTDAGMTGPHDSIIGIEKEPALGAFLNGMPARFEPATGNPAAEWRVVIEADDKTGRATEIDAASATPSGELLELPDGRPTRASPRASDDARCSTCRSRNRNLRRRRSTPDAPAAHDAILTVSRADRADPDAARRASSSKSGSRASCRTAGSGTRATCTSR